jgi:hypothetical protein
MLTATALVGTPIPAHAAYSDGWFEFHKNGADPRFSRLDWKYTVDGGDPIYGNYWRAGSGLQYDPRWADDCIINVGWLPNGQYDIYTMWHNWSNPGDVQGRLWELQSKVCWNGSETRTALLIHTNETSDNRSLWTGDYNSNGCIKLATTDPPGYSDIGAAHWWYHNVGPWPDDDPRLGWWRLGVYYP